MVWQPRGEDRTTCSREFQENWNFTPNSNSIRVFDHYVMLKCVVQVWVPSHVSPSRKRRESLPRRASSLWASSHALHQEQFWWVKSWEMSPWLWGVILGLSPAHFACRCCQWWDSTCRLSTEYLTIYSSCYFCVPVIHVSPFLVGLSCRTERFSVMPTPHKKLMNGLKFFSGNW